MTEWAMGICKEGAVRKTASADILNQNHVWGLEKHIQDVSRC